MEPAPEEAEALLRGRQCMPVSRTKLLRAYNALADTLTPHQQYGVLVFLCEVLDRTYTKTEILRWAEQVQTREGAAGKGPPVGR